MTEEKDFKGYIHDVGGPTANFRFPACEKQMTKGVCPQQTVSVPGALPESAGGSSGLYRIIKKTAGTSKGEEGLYPFRYSV